jgi:predicted O-methyltransferase YrrM
MSQRTGLTPHEEGLKFTTDWISRHTGKWDQFLGHLVGKSVVQFLEIGSWEGRSTCWFLQNILTDDSAHITCIDTFEGAPSEVELHEHIREAVPNIEEFFDHNIKHIGAESKVTKVKGYSQEIMRTLPTNYYDVIVIDGSHIASDVYMDAGLAWMLLKEGGIIIFDDYQWNCMIDPESDALKPRPAIDAFIQCFADKIEVLDADLQAIIKKTST